ncbi:hypothetical protein NW762_011031 [Fusarium torreyae]|uniref:Uncharacterized protein n=1 Tax=Fusarium torreyae TaxID=1237075 RepID=A0A9W8RUI3_9HYPO|nr:hypothetical protein NW762_011031 [Fusarium torreyae]
MAMSNAAEASVQDSQVSPPNFVEELRGLSLQAAAERERHLGSSSGLSFAKLTQTVLRRLTPDKADFVFQGHNPGAPFFDINSPSELFNDAIFASLSESISIHPLLFDDLFLADIAEPDITVNNLAWPSDEAHVQQLVDFYFAHSHTLYPILKRSDVMKTLNRIRGNPQQLADLQTLEAFRVWMVLAIGSTAQSSVSLTEESESRLYYSKALQLSEVALEMNEMPHD